jgi:hypothetical protein
MSRAVIARIGSAAALFAALAACGNDFVMGRPEPFDASAGGATRTPGNPGVAAPDGGVFSFGPTDAATTCFSPGAFCPGQVQCPGGGATTLTGHVFDPAGKTPLYNAVVFIPQGPLPPIPLGTKTCSTCGIAIGDYVTAAVTDDKGAFTLTNSPMGKNIPLVVQVGKWRRQTVIPTVPMCQTTQVPAELTRLPRNRFEGDLPQMAVSTGACDGLACFLRRVGVDAQEFTGPDVNGHVHVYRGAGPGPDLAGGGGGTAGDCTGASASCPLWTTKAQLERYDTVFLGCECGENNQTKPDRAPMHDWLDEGGTVIAVHNQETWFKNGPSDFQGVATWSSSDAGAPGPFVNDTTFPKGQIFQRWLGGVGALAPDGTVALAPADVNATMTSANPNANAESTRWIYGEGDGGAATATNVEYLSFHTPVGGIVSNPEGNTFCGRAVITDVHVGAGAAPSSAPVPASCDAGDLSPEEKALEFLLFDSSECVEDALSPPNPVPPPPN